MTTLKYGIQRSIFFSLQLVTKRHTKSLTIEEAVCNYKYVYIYIYICIYMYIYIYIYILKMCYKISENLNSWNSRDKIRLQIGVI